MKDFRLTKDFKISAALQLTDRLMSLTYFLEMI